MPIRKRGKYWHIQFTAPNGERVRQSARTTSRREAEELEARLKARFWREERLGQPQATWREAVVSWLKSTTHKDRDGVLAKLRWLDAYLGDAALKDITPALLHQIKTAKLAEASPSTVNRHMAAVSAVLRHAQSAGWIESPPKVPRLKEPKEQWKWLTREEAARLIEALDAQPRSAHISDMARFTLATGLRESNVTGLEWARVQEDACWIPASQMKGGRALRVPLNADAKAVLERWRGKHDRWVFVYRGDRIRKANRDGFQAALKATGLDIRWHDLRHTWASWHAMAGTPLAALMELGGWSSYQMVLRYAHLAPDHLSRYAENI